MPGPISRHRAPCLRLAGPVLGAALLAATLAGPALGWGAMGHGLVTEYAVERLPGPLGELFRASKDFLVCYSILPDGWWGSPALLPKLPPGLESPTGVVGMTELEQHVMTVDGPVYEAIRGPGGSLALKPMTREQARGLCRGYVALKGEAALEEHVKDRPGYTGGLDGLAETLFARFGRNPWAVEDRLADLTGAMRAGRWQRALLLATALGHYVGDSHVPLHTAYDHDGIHHRNPLVKGIHARWEAGLVERYEAVHRKLLGGRGPGAWPAAIDARPEALTALVYGALSRSGSLVEGIVKEEDAATRDLALDRGLMGLPAKERDARVHDRAYYARFFARQGASVYQRLDASVDAVVAVWLMAWERAGRPAPPAGFVSTTPLVVIDWKASRIVPFDPRRGHKD